MSDPVKKWGATGKNTMLAEIMQTGDDLVSEIKSLRSRVAELEAMMEKGEPVAYLHSDGRIDKLYSSSAKKLFLHSGPTVQQWQPIETAPKDGTNIILSNGSSVAQGWWMHVDGGIYERRDIDGNYTGQDEIDGYIGWWDVDGGMIKEPTHWMPLPPPPAMREGEKE